MPVAANRLDNLRTLRFANLDAAFATAFGTLVGGSFLVGLIRYFHGGDGWIGITAALPSFLGLLQIPGALWGRGFTSYKRFVLPGGLIWRLLYIPIIALPFLAISGEASLFILILCVGLASAAVQIVSPIYNDWLAELVPENSRGWFFSRRNGIAASVGAVGGVIGGLALDWLRKGGHDSLAFSSIFGFGCFCGLVSFAFFMRMADTPRPHPIRVPLAQGLQDLKKPFVHKQFRGLLIFFIVFIAGQALAGNLYSAFALESLKMPYTILQLTALSMAAGQLLSIRMWGYLADKYGNKPIIGILSVGLVLTPIIWLFCVPGHDLRNSIILIVGHVFNGIVWSGIGVCQFNLLLVTAEPKDRANYIGVGLALQAIVGGISPMIGAALMSVYRGYFDVAAAYKWLFATQMAVRLLAIFFLFGVHEEGAVSVRRTLKQLREVTPKGFKALKQLSSSADIATREHAMGDLAEEHFSLASDEIIKSLHDPSPRLRRMAARALSKMNDPRAVHELIHQLVEHPDLVEEETVEALGEIGDALAVGELMKCLHHPRSAVRRAAAWALGRIGSHEAAEALMNSANQPGDPDLRRAALQALRVIEAREAEFVIADALFDSHPSVRIAAAEAVSELGLKTAQKNLRQALDWYEDEASSEVAYALGCVGNWNDIPLILREAQRSVSVITRRRCLLGVARLLGVEQETYKIMLLEGMSRDNALLEIFRSSSRRSKRLRASLSQFSSGDEAGALTTISQGRVAPELRILAEQPVQELFIVAAFVYDQRLQQAHRRKR